MTDKNIIEILDFCNIILKKPDLDDIKYRMQRMF